MVNEAYLREFCKLIGVSVPQFRSDSKMTTQDACLACLSGEFANLKQRVRELELQVHEMDQTSRSR